MFIHDDVSVLDVDLAYAWSASCEAYKCCPCGYGLRDWSWLFFFGA
jgi:hypothetical protein